jgi:hypothetical protein
MDLGAYNGVREGDGESREGERVESAISWGNSLACLQAATRGVDRAGGCWVSHENSSAEERESRLYRVATNNLLRDTALRPLWGKSRCVL